MVEKGLLDYDYTDSNSNFTEGDYIILFREGTNVDRRAVDKQMLIDSSYYNSVLSNSYVRNVLGNKYNTNYTMGNE